MNCSNCNCNNWNSWDSQFNNSNDIFGGSFTGDPFASSGINTTGGLGSGTLPIYTIIPLTNSSSSWGNGNNCRCFRNDVTYFNRSQVWRNC